MHAGAMPRQPRFWSPDAVLHVVQRGNNRTAIVADDHVRLYFLASLAKPSRLHGVAVHAYVLMTNHIHMVVSLRASSTGCSAAIPTKVVSVATWSPAAKLGQGQVERRAARGLAPLQSRTDSAVIFPAAMAGGKTGLVLCQVGGQ